MKKIYIVLLILLGFGLYSCTDFLNVTDDLKDRLTIEEVFQNETYTEQWLSQAYSYLGKGTISDVCINGQWPFAFSDDMYNPLYKSFKEVTYSEETDQDTWTDAFKGIRQASTFIKYVHLCEELSEEERIDYKGQARFIRAYYYWKLLQKYGPIPILPEEGQDYIDDYYKLSVPRNTYEECADYIASEMAQAARELPLKRELLSAARPTRGAALSIRAKVLLYAASPLMNGKGGAYAQELVDDKGNPLLSTTYDEEKWARAAAAAKDVMDLGVYKLHVAYARPKGTPGYPATLPPFNDGNFSEKKWPEGYKDIDPFESYRSVFNGELGSIENPELIFTRGQNQLNQTGINHMVLHQLPNKAQGMNRSCMTQKQCDAYYMNDGSDVPGKDREIGRGDGSSRLTGFVSSDDVRNGRYRPLVAGVSLQYADREPRFYASVGYNGAVWGLANASRPENRGPYTCWYYRGGNEGKTNSSNWQLTGIGIMKFVRPNDTNDDFDIDAVSSHVTKKPDIALRYADILLMYSEALNELTGSHQIPSWDGAVTHTISRDVKEIKKGIQPVRIRAGVPDYEESVYADQNTLRDKIKRERQIELMGEGQRYFDLRRWMDAAKEESLQMYGCNVLMSVQQRDLYHQPVPINDVLNCFSEKTYFWPIHRD